MSWLWAVGFASAGVALRFVLSRWSVAGFGVGVLLCNVLGSLWVGLLASGVLDRYFPANTKALFVLAFLGSFTTFSAYAMETVQYLASEKWQAMALCIFSHNLLSISACYIGFKNLAAFFSPAS